MILNRTILANVFLVLLALFYLIMLGGGTYEVMNVGSKLSQAPPRSFQMLDGPYGFNPVKFWVIFRPITILLFILAIVTNWPYRGRRLALTFAFCIDICITVTTFSYFAPEIGSITSVGFQDRVDINLAARVAQWESLNLIRLAAFYVVSLAILASITMYPKTRAKV